MIGLVLIYFIGKAFYDLASRFNQSKWGFAILGIVSYYLGLLLGGFSIGILYEIFSPGEIENVSEPLLGAMAIPAGALACWGLYKFLEKKWSNPPVPKGHNVLDENI